MKIYKKEWGLFVIVVLSVFGIFEYIAISDNNAETWSLTQTIVQNVPSEWFVALFGGFTLWFWFHFMRRYNKKDD